MIKQIVNSVADVMDVLEVKFPHTTIDNLYDSQGNKLPIKGVFYRDQEEARLFGSNDRLVVYHSKGEDYYFQSREDAIDQAIMAFQSVKAMGGDAIEMVATFNKGYSVSFTQKIERKDRKFMFENDIIFPTYNFNFSYDSVSRGGGGCDRFCCSNLITTTRVAGFSFSFRHTKNAGERMIAIQAGIADIANNWGAFLQHCEMMGKKSVNLLDVYSRVWGDKPGKEGRKLTVWNDRLGDMQTRLNRESSLLGLSPANGWLVFNAVQGYLQHDTTRKVDNVLVRADQANNSKELLQVESLILGA